MSKERVNAALHRLTGHHLVKGAPGELVRRDARRIQRLQTQVRQLERDLRSARRGLSGGSPELERQMKRVQARLQAAEGQRDRLQRALDQRERGTGAGRARGRAAGGFPADYDEDVRATIKAVRGYTMTGNDQLHALIGATKYITQHKIPGEVVECGVWRGGSMHTVARVLDQLGDHSRELYLFDTFEGMPPPTEDDVRWDGAAAATLLKTSGRGAAVWAVATLEDVRAGFASVPYPAEKIHYVQGKVEDTLPDALPDRISILRLDTDWYESTAHELTHAYARLSPGGVLFIDDYGHWAGSRKATDEFLERTGEPLLLFRAGASRVAIKPWAQP